eukprot:CAMPEP_0115339458 /NCGR_PEP_ID=MMETSP0270-20121206/90626_1 /TAXON_ID=71861 /ORGANISM="Scrippsiella trochoidea, Strain CCMP3099" /LENGTH=105 /DNA_ID=CAMNT_0002760851 /DNA_START=21 /DNA_END=338 /DNA_ORIENTATION=-
MASAKLRDSCICWAAAVATFDDFKPTDYCIEVGLELEAVILLAFNLLLLLLREEQKLLSDLEESHGLAIVAAGNGIEENLSFGVNILDVILAFEHVGWIAIEPRV